MQNQDFDFEEGINLPPAPQRPERNPRREPPRNVRGKGRFRRFFRGYLMVVGALTTILMLAWGLVALLIKVQELMNRVP